MAWTPCSWPIGTRFGRLVLQEKIVNFPEKWNVRWKCICDCGNFHLVSSSSLKKGSVSSCGCLKRELNRINPTTHGLSHKPEFQIWLAMRRRCKDVKQKAYINYGGRGITYDPAWDDFGKFFEDMGSRPSLKHSLDRVDNQKDYGRSNCRWATREEQARNRRGRLLVSYQGTTYPFMDFVEKMSLPTTTAYGYVARGTLSKHVPGAIVLPYIKTVRPRKKKA